MSPTDEQIENLLGQVAQLEQARFHAYKGVIMPVLQGEPPADSLAWADLQYEQKRDVMAAHITFEGFSPEQELNVIESVASGKEPSELMQDIQTDRAIRDLEMQWGYEEMIRESVQMRPDNDNDRGRTR